MNLYATQLECLLVILGLGTLLTDAFRPGGDRRKLGYLLATLVTITLLYSFTLAPTADTFFHGMYRLDSFALFFKRLFLLATAFVLLMGAEFVERFETGVAEFYALVLLAATGMLVIASVNDFILLFVALELVTITFYILTAFLRRQVQSLEAGTKYLILGALSSGFTVYGIAYIFGTTGTTNFDKLATLLSAGGSGSAFLLGMLLVLTGLGFKVASVPFQIWAPDVYQGAPTPVTAFLAVGSKAAGFALLLRVMLAGLLPVSAVWMPVLLVLAAATLGYGNLGAISQRNIKRLLGYSSIGHAGYMLMGLAAGNALGSQAVLFYLGQYAFTNLCAFLVIIAVGREEIADYAGLGKRSPILGAALFLAMASLAGIPPLSGFFGKFQLFAAVIEAAQTNWHYYILAGIGAGAVVVSLYYYFNVGRAIYIEEAKDTTPIPVSLPVRAGLYVCMLAMIGLGIYQQPLVEAATLAAGIFGLK
ncbi:MAG: NAD(P)H-quinone oxidoreductase subunit 2, chloroplastic [Verrucomicrobiae bacterium]|nr:NAD(P)H-quinone oxidoreductase subunit 2, chloroplastic [Verrucomicrobiae bacterium]